MQKNGVIYPNIAENLVSMCRKNGEIKVERVGKIMDIDPENQNNAIAEKMIVFWGKFVITVLRANMTWLGNFPVLTYKMEKYPNAESGKIIAEISNLRKEWTSGIF